MFLNLMCIKVDYHKWEKSPDDILCLGGGVGEVGGGSVYGKGKLVIVSTVVKKKITIIILKYLLSA